MLVLYDFGTAFKDYFNCYPYEDEACYRKFMHKVMNRLGLERIFDSQGMPMIIGLYDNYSGNWVEADYLYTDEDYANSYNYFEDEVEWDKEATFSVEEIYYGSDDRDVIGFL